MPQQESRVGDLHCSAGIDSSACFGEAETPHLAELQTHAADEAGAAIASRLNGPLTALLLYMGEIRQQCHLFSQVAADRLYLQTIVENALEQTERVYTLVKQIGGAHEAAPSRNDGNVVRSDMREPCPLPRFAPTPETGRKPLTKREREVLDLVSEGCTNKEGALRMRISPRTFESHRAEVMRKLGARNTADLVRAALSLPSR